MDRCPVSRTLAECVRLALVAPFIADYVLPAPVERRRLGECSECDRPCFAERFTREELARLCTGYRVPEYFRPRHRHEPWYTEPERSAARRQGLAAFLREAGATGPFAPIFDYGDEAGQLIPLELTADPCFYDICGVDPVPGVARLATEAGLRPGGYHLLLLSHVLEHVAGFARMLRVPRDLTRADDGLLEVEVPFERPWMGLQGQPNDSIACSARAQRPH